MKKISIFIALMMSVSILFGLQPSNDERSEVAVDSELFQMVSPTECYVLFLLQGSGVTMTAAKTVIDEKLQDFSRNAEKTAPGVKIKVLTINIGTREFTSSSSDRDTFIPTINRVLICTLPVNETQAIALLDCGIKAGLVPFCGASNDGTMHSGIYYGVTNPAVTLDSLRKESLQKLTEDAEKMAKLQSGKRGKLLRLASSPESSGKECKLNFAKINITLPIPFCSTDKNQVKVSLKMFAVFELILEKP